MYLEASSVLESALSSDRGDPPTSRQPYVPSTCKSTKTICKMHANTVSVEVLILMYVQIERITEG